MRNSATSSDVRTTDSPRVHGETDIVPPRTPFALHRGMHGEDLKASVQTCVECGAKSPQTETNYTLISSLRMAALARDPARRPARLLLALPDLLGTLPKEATRRSLRTRNSVEVRRSSRLRDSDLLAAITRRAPSTHGLPRRAGVAAVTTVVVVRARVDLTTVVASLVAVLVGRPALA